jgi:hypothetical protein
MSMNPKRFHPICHLTPPAFTHDQQQNINSIAPSPQLIQLNNFHRIDSQRGIFGDAIDHISLKRIPENATPDPFPSTSTAAQH